jgi:uncharacterized protein YgbK (DUF1537 family)
VIGLLVGADDRTGALESAAALADVGLGPVPVVVHPEEPDADERLAVVDLGTRALDGREAAARASALAGLPARRHAHKIDSTLRGRWADELVAHQRTLGHPVLVVPALPAQRRTCVGGEVRDQGRPVATGPAGDDVRAPIGSSRPAVHLRAAGAPDVIELAREPDLVRWLVANQPPFAVCDAATATDLTAIGEAWARHGDVLFAGTSASIAAAAAALAQTRAAPAVRPEPPALRPPVLVVCGSLHPAARQQVAALVEAGCAAGQVGGTLDWPVGASLEWAADPLAAGRPAVLTSPAADRVGVPDGGAPAMARTLARATHELVSAVEIGTLVVIGGDVAAEVLGPAPMVVGGSIAPGVAWCHRDGGGGPLVLTRAGGFGGPQALVELLGGALVP